MPYNSRMSISLRPEEMDVTAYDKIWIEVNKHLGTSAGSIDQLVEQLGIMRFGRTA